MEEESLENNYNKPTFAFNWNNYTQLRVTIMPQ